MDKTIGNQPVKEENIIWLSGFIDGEGTIGLYRYQKNNKPILKPRIQIVNTSWRPIKEIERIYNFYSISYHISEAEQRPQWKPRILIAVLKRDSCIKLLEKILPYLVEKKPQAEILYKFLINRSERFNKNKGYTNEELESVEALKQINFRGVLYPKLTS